MDPWPLDPAVDCPEVYNLPDFNHILVFLTTKETIEHLSMVLLFTAESIFLSVVFTAFLRCSSKSLSSHSSTISILTMLMSDLSRASKLSLNMSANWHNSFFSASLWPILHHMCRDIAFWIWWLFYSSPFSLVCSLLLFDVFPPPPLFLSTCCSMFSPLLEYCGMGKPSITINQGLRVSRSTNVSYP